MLTDRAIQLDAEEASSGHPAIWREVYTLMQCPGSPCDLGRHCWRDPSGKKHYRLRTHHLKALIEFVQQGNALRTHDDVPDDIREQLYAEEQQRLQRQPRSTNASTPSFPPINITNVLPSSYSSPTVSTLDPALTAAHSRANGVYLNIPGPRDLAVRRYSEWQQTQVVDENLKIEFQKACNVTLDDGADLELVYDDQDPGFFVQWCKTRSCPALCQGHRVLG